MSTAIRNGRRTRRGSADAGVAAQMDACEAVPRDRDVLLVALRERVPAAWDEPVATGCEAGVEVTLLARVDRLHELPLRKRLDLDRRLDGAWRAARIRRVALDGPRRARGHATLHP